MKKQISMFIRAAAVFGISFMASAPVRADATKVEYGGYGYATTDFNGASWTDMSGGPASVTNVRVVNYNQYDTGTSGANPSVQNGPNMYYVRPSRRAAMYEGWQGCEDEYCPPPPVMSEPAAAPPPPRAPMQSTRADTARRVADRKYHLAHPFFQPQQGRIGSVTDIGYAKNSYNFDVPVIAPSIITGGGGFYDGISGKWTAAELYIKEDLSYGITDALAVIGSAKFGFDDYKMAWNDPAIPNDKASDNGFNQAGVGLQWRFYDDADWIAYVGGYYQWLDIANAFVADAKLGYKVANSTIYGLARVWYVGWDDNSYGNGITDPVSRQTTYIAFKRDVDSSVYIETGIGLFSALDDEWSLNLELTLGDYDWHSQAGIGAGLNFQPTQQFAIGVYGRMSVWDSADDKNSIEMWGWTPTIPATFIGNTNISKYSDMSLGVKAYLYF